MTRTTRTKINRETLWKIIEEQCGGNATAFDKSIGRSNGYSHNYKPGRKVNGKEMLDMANTDILLIKALYGVDITYVEPEPEEEEAVEYQANEGYNKGYLDGYNEAKNEAEFDFEKLEKSIYKAVYSALLHSKNKIFIEREKDEQVGGM